MKMHNHRKMLLATFSCFLTLACSSVVFAMMETAEGKKEEDSNNLPIQSIPQKSSLENSDISTLLKHSFTIPNKNNNNKLTITPSMYPYKPVIPAKTRLFFEGEAVIIDPKSPFESYVTSPVHPCLVGRIYDPATKKSLIFHKYAIHGIESLEPFYKKFADSNAANYQVEIYTSQMEPKTFNQFHKSIYKNKTQETEMRTVKTFFCNQFKIPENNIQLRMFLLQDHAQLSIDSPYFSAYTTIGIQKTGEIFHTSFTAEDIFDLKEVTAFSLNGQKKRFSLHEPKDQWNIVSTLLQSISNTVKNHFVGTDEAIRSKGCENLEFFSSEELDQSAVSLKKIFNIKFNRKGLDMIIPFKKQNL